MVAQGPEDDVEVFTAVLEMIENGINQRRSLESRSQKSKIPLVELNPERLALKMLEPAVP